MGVPLGSTAIIGSAPSPTTTSVFEQYTRKIRSHLKSTTRTPLSNQNQHELSAPQHKHTQYWRTSVSSKVHMQLTIVSPSQGWQIYFGNRCSAVKQETDCPYVPGIEDSSPSWSWLYSSCWSSCWCWRIPGLTSLGHLHSHLSLPSYLLSISSLWLHPWLVG